MASSAPETVIATYRVRADKEQEFLAVLRKHYPTLKNLGLVTDDVPVVYREPTDADVDAFMKLTDDPSNRPMFIHCTAAIRVGAFWLIRRVVRDDMSWDAALEEARKVGLVNAPHLEEFAKGYISRHPK